MLKSENKTIYVRIVVGKTMDSKIIGLGIKKLKCWKAERLLTSQVKELQIAKAMKILIKRNDATLFELSQCR
jgi:hypothetical protein